MSAPLDVRVVRRLAALLARLHPRRFQAANAESFGDVAEDRWRRERAAGASRLAALLTTARVLIADAWTSARLTRRSTTLSSSRTRTMIDALTTATWYAFRSLARSPLLTSVATISLAIGIGGNAAVFSAANALLFAAPTGVASPDRLVDICRTTDGTGCDTLAYPTFLDYRDRMTALTDVYAMRFEATPFSLGAAEGASVVYGQQVTTNYFSVLGVQAAAGRLFEQTDPHDLAPIREVVISYSLWQRHFGGDRSVVGRSLELNGDQYVVTGVASDGFTGATVVRADVWVPLTSGGRGMPLMSLLRSRESLWLVMGGRLAPGATLDRARAETQAVQASLVSAFPTIYKHRGLAMFASRRMPAGFGEVAPFIGLLMGLVGLVLAVACANLGGLLLARGSARSREIAVRRALGATRASLVTMWLLEGVVLFLPGLLLAFLLAPAALTTIERMATNLPVPVDAHLPIDWRVVAFTTAVTLAMALATAIVPAWQTSGGALIPDLKQDASAPRRQRLRQVFVAAQVAFCLVSIAMAGVLLRAAHEAAGASPGFTVDNIDVATVDFGLASYTDAQVADTSRALETRLSAIPGVRAVAAGTVVPLAGDAMSFDDLRRAGDTRSIEAQWSLVSSTYLSTVGIPIVRGRDFTAADRGEHPRDIIVNERFAATVWPNQDPVGQHLDLGDFRPGHEASIHTVTVVGVARNAKYEWPGEGPTSFIYVPLAEYPFLRVHYFVAHDPAMTSAAVATGIRQTLHAFDRTLPLIDDMPLAQYAELGLLPKRIASTVAGALGLLALALAAVGLYGLTAFIVTGRTREIGIRVALGATRAGILRLIVWNALRMAAAGALVGLVLSALASRLLASALYGVPSMDTSALVAAVAVVSIVATGATYLPARRAAGINPTDALRVD